LDIRYGGGNISGFFGNDTVRIGAAGSSQLVIPNSTFGVAENVSLRFGENAFDGIFGLGFTKHYIGYAPPLINAMQQELLDERIVTFFLETRGSNSTHEGGGVITFGGLDRTNCGDVLGYANLTIPTSMIFDFEAVRIGDYNNTRAFQAFSDSGSTLIYGPSNDMKEIAKRINATFNDKYGIFTIPCNSTYDPITFTINGTDYNVTSTVLNLDVGVIDGNATDTNLCLFGMYPMDIEELWAFGDVFIRQFCHVYDYGQKRIGFAKPKCFEEGQMAGGSGSLSVAGYLLVLAFALAML